MIADGDRYAPRVPANTRRYLDLLEASGARATFFTVGDVARRHPELVAEIAARGHEVGCHSSDHVPLDRLDRDGLRRDLERNLEDLARAGAGTVTGFRAPVMSLTARSDWAYEVMAELGLRYSSSVVPGPGTLYGWPEFGDAPRRMPGGVWEIPLSVAGVGRARVPFGAGIYFRLLPFPLLAHLFRRTARRGRPVVGYLHPYDLDTEQERFMHPGLGESRILNALMYVNRHRVVPRLNRLLRGDLSVECYAAYLEGTLEPGAATGG